MGRKIVERYSGSVPPNHYTATANPELPATKAKDRHLSYRINGYFCITKRFTVRRHSIIRFSSIFEFNSLRGKEHFTFHSISL